MKKNIQLDCWVAPAPVIIVSSGSMEGESNIATFAWSGNICSDPPMAYVSVRPERQTYKLIEETGEFVLNLATNSLVNEADMCGMYSGKSTDKWEKTGLEKEMASEVSTPLVVQCPVSVECKVTQKIHLGSHDMFIGKIVAIDADEEYIDEYGRLKIDDANLLSLVHTDYVPLGEKSAEMGFTIRKKTAPHQRKSSNFKSKE